jgi:hypothetical protein
MNNMGVALRNAFAPPLPREQQMLREMPALRPPPEAITANIGAALKSSAASGTGNVVDKMA